GTLPVGFIGWLNIQMIVNRQGAFSLWMVESANHNRVSFCFMNPRSCAEGLQKRYSAACSMRDILFVRRIRADTWNLYQLRQHPFKLLALAAKKLRFIFSTHQDPPTFSCPADSKKSRHRCSTRGDRRLPKPLHPGSLYRCYQRL